MSKRTHPRNVRWIYTTSVYSISFSLTNSPLSLSLSPAFAFHSLVTWRIDPSSGILLHPDSNACLSACHEKWTDHVGSYSTAMEFVLNFRRYRAMLHNGPFSLSQVHLVALGCTRKQPQVLQNVDMCESRTMDVALWYTLFCEKYEFNSAMWDSFHSQNDSFGKYFSTF